MINIELKEILIEKELYSKDWDLNSNRSAEAMILLNMIATFKAKSHTVNNRRILIIMDNKKVWRIIYTLIETSNQHNQDSAAEIIMIQELIDKIEISLPIKRESGHQDIKCSFQQNPGLHLLAMYDQKARLI